MIGVGLDIGGTFAKFAVVKRRGPKAFRVLETGQIPTGTATSAKAFFDVLGAEVARLRRAHHERVAHVGLGVAGNVDAARGIVRFSPNLASWGVFPAGRLLARAAGCDVLVENDANMAAWGAYAAEFKRAYGNVLALTLGTGVGGGIVLDHKLFTGSTGMAGEVGHMYIAKDGPPSPSGDRGTVESFVGRRALERACGGLEPRELARRAARGERRARKAWAEMGRHLGRALVNFTLTLNPDAVVLTGGLAKASRHFLPAAREVLRAHAMQLPLRHMKLRVARLDNLGSIGAALYALEPRR